MIKILLMLIPTIKIMLIIINNNYKNKADLIVHIQLLKIIIIWTIKTLIIIVDSKIKTKNTIIFNNLNKINKITVTNKTNFYKIKNNKIMVDQVHKDLWDKIIISMDLLKLII